MNKHPKSTIWIIPKANQLIEEASQHRFCDNCYQDQYGTFSRPSPAMSAWLDDVETFILSNFDQDNAPWQIFSRFKRKKLDGYYEEDMEKQKVIILSALQACISFEAKPSEHCQDSSTEEKGKSISFYVLSSQIALIILLSGWEIYYHYTRKDRQPSPAEKVGTPVPEDYHQPESRRKNILEEIDIGSVPNSSRQYKTLGVTPEEFRRTFNQNIAQVDTDYKLPFFDIEKGDAKDSFKCMVSSHIELFGTVNKNDGSLRYLLVLFALKNHPAENSMSIAVIIAATQALNSDVEKNDNSKVVTDMVARTLANLNPDKPVRCKIEKLEYMASIIEASDCTMIAFHIKQR